MRKLLTGCICLLFLTEHLFAVSRKDTISCHISFPINEYVLRPSAELDSVSSHFQLLQKNEVSIHRILLSSGASLEGKSTLNQILSDQRAQTVQDYLQDQFDLPVSLFEIHSSGEDYTHLRKLVSLSGMPYRDQVLDIIDHTPEYVIRNGQIVDSRKRQLMNLDHGKVWFYMRDHFFPELRQCVVTLIINDTTIQRAPEILPKLEPAEKVIPDPYLLEVAPMDSVFQVPPSSENIRKSAGHFSVHSNLLNDLLLVPNLGMEFSLGKGWSLGFNWKHAWWKNEQKHQFWRIYGAETYVRKYFGHLSKTSPSTGHHLGLLGQLYTYDFMVGKKGYIGGKPHGNLLDQPHWGVSLEYGYALPLAENWHLDFSIAVGYCSGYIYEYEYKYSQYVWQTTIHKRWIGPSKAEISLVWDFGW